MSLKCGIVGLPNVGKSTLFNALTKAGIAAENYPFCTIEPNVGIVEVPDPRLGVIAGIAQPQKVVPAVVEFVDIAGLVAGASKGEGLGNKFLANIRETDAIAHVVRCFEDPNVVHVAGKIDPVSDIETINTELALADLDSVEQADLQVREGRADRRRQGRAAAGGGAEEGAGGARRRASCAHRGAAPSEERGGHQAAVPAHHEADHVRRQRGRERLRTIRFSRRSRAHAAKEGAPVVPISAAIESQIADMSDEDKQLFLADMGMEEPGLNRVIRAAYALLGLQTYFTAGPKEVRAWTVPVGATAPQAAGVIHTDFERGFIRAEVAAYDDYVAAGGEQGAKEAGKLRLEGKDYVVRDGDVIHFRFNV